MRKQSTKYIPRTDLTMRCGYCLRPINRSRIKNNTEPMFLDDRVRGYRFNKVGTCCRILQIKSNKL